MPNCSIGFPRRKDRNFLSRRLCTPVTDANLCHSDANHCHRALMAEKKSLLPLYSLPKPKSLSLCKNRRMNGATAERCPSTPGLYQEKSPTTNVSSCSKAIYVRPEFHQRIQRIVRLLDNDKISMYSYLDRVLEHHFASFDEEITAWCRNRFQALSRDLKTTLSWE